MTLVSGNRNIFRSSRRFLEGRHQTGVGWLEIDEFAVFPIL